MARRHLLSEPRFSEIRRVLDQRRRELLRRMAVKRNDVRTGGERSRATMADECAPPDSLDDLDTALIEMSSQMLVRIDMAIRRIEQGQYGICVECAGEIAQARLRALPFAMRCRGCEEAHERKRAPAHSGRAVQSVWKE